ncbi:MAG: NAD(P)-dependent dehydrogenase (short-subunit alcohol dehydrogenase family) [Bacteroidia bacterium]|jgi:NAD(P)-dependent dehydrogenase (short-subunit alcohol dehydrogenase family)
MSVAVVIGVNASNGLGAAIARQFATQGMHTVVAGRTQQRLQQVAAEITSAGGSCTACVADATDAAQLENLMFVAGGIGPVHSVIFNVGNNRLLSFDDLTAELFEQFWRVCTLSAFLTAKAALPALLETGGSLLFTGASASMRGKPGFAHFSAAKAGLRNLAQALAKDYGPRGVHVGHVVVDGVINGELVQTLLGEYLEHLGEDGSLEPDAIAQSYWFLHSQPRNAWTFELDVRPFKEVW